MGRTFIYVTDRRVDGFDGWKYVTNERDVDGKPTYSLKPFRVERDGRVFLDDPLFLSDEESADVGGIDGVRDRVYESTEYLHQVYRGRYKETSSGNIVSDWQLVSFPGNRAWKYTRWLDI